jgi:hypothetical protein
MAQRSLILAAILLLPVLAQAATMRVIPPTAYADGDPIPAGTAFQFKLYGGRCGTELKLLSTFTALEYQRNPVGTGDHCYKTTAAVIDENGVPGTESEMSAGYTLTVAATPDPDPPKPVARQTQPPTDAVLDSKVTP